MKRQLFIISGEAFRAIGYDEAKATEEGLKEIEMFHLPFPEVDVRISGDEVAYAKYSPSPKVDLHLARGTIILRDGNIRTNYGDGHWMDYLNISLSHHNYTKWIEIDKTNTKGLLATRKLLPGSSSTERDAVARVLIVLLATRNAVKTTAHNKLAKHGIGKGTKRYEYVTTITVPQILEDDEEHKPTGIERAPHLRRGHIRRQHYGTGNALIKMKWIDPVFVNADKEWLATRKAYRLG